MLLPVAHNCYGKTKSHGTTNFTHGKTLLIHGKTKLTHGKTPLIHGKTKLTRGKTLLMHGKTLLIHGKTKVTRGKTNFTHGKTKKTSWSAVVIYTSEMVRRVTVTHCLLEKPLFFELTIFCSACGSVVEEDANFCKSCGRGTFLNLKCSYLHFFSSK